MGYNRAKDIACDFPASGSDSKHTYEPGSQNHNSQNANNSTFNKRKRSCKPIDKALPLPPPTSIESMNQINNSPDPNFDSAQKQQPMQLTNNTTGQVFLNPVPPPRSNSRRENMCLQNKTNLISTSSTTLVSQHGSEREENQMALTRPEKHNVPHQDKTRKPSVNNSHPKDSIPESSLVQNTPPPMLVDRMNTIKIIDCIEMENASKSSSAKLPKRNPQHKLPSNLMAPTKSKCISAPQTIEVDHNLQLIPRNPDPSSRFPSPLSSPPQSPAFSFFAANVHNAGIDQFISSLSLPLPPAPVVKSARESLEKRFSDTVNSDQYENPDLTQLAEEALLDMQNPERWLEDPPQPHNWRYSNTIESFISEDLSVLDSPSAPDLSFSPAFAKSRRPLSVSSNNLNPANLLLIPPPAILSISKTHRSSSSLLFNTLTSSVSNLSSATSKQYKKRRPSRFDGFKKASKEASDTATFGPTGRDNYNSRMSNVKRKKKFSRLSGRLKTAVISIFRTAI